MPSSARKKKISGVTPRARRSPFALTMCAVVYPTIGTVFDSITCSLALFVIDTAAVATSTLSLHDALPICHAADRRAGREVGCWLAGPERRAQLERDRCRAGERE